MYLGDNLLNRRHHAVRRGVRAREAGARRSCSRACPTRRCSASPSSTDGTVVRLVEKPKEPKSDLALVGVYMFGREIFDVGQGASSRASGNELEITDAIQDLIDRGLQRPAAHRRRLVEGHRQARGHARGQPADPRDARARGSTARWTPSRGRGQGRDRSRARVIERSVVRGPAIIGAGAPDRRRLRRAVHVDRRATSRSASRRSSTASCSRARASATSPTASPTA